MTEAEFNPHGIKPLGNVWVVFIAPNGEVLGPGVDFGVDARVGFALWVGDHWQVLSKQEAEEIQRQACIGAN